MDRLPSLKRAEKAALSQDPAGVWEITNPALRQLSSAKRLGRSRSYHRGFWHERSKSTLLSESRSSGISSSSTGSGEESISVYPHHGIQKQKSADLAPKLKKRSHLQTKKVTICETVTPIESAVPSTQFHSLQAGDPLRHDPHVTPVLPAITPQGAAQLVQDTVRKAAEQDEELVNPADITNDNIILAADRTMKSSDGSTGASYISNKTELPSLHKPETGVQEYMVAIGNSKNRDHKQCDTENEKDTDTLNHNGNVDTKAAGDINCERDPGNLNTRPTGDPDKNDHDTRLDGVSMSRDVETLTYNNNDDKSYGGDLCRSDINKDSDKPEPKPSGSNNLGHETAENSKVTVQESRGHNSADIPSATETEMRGKISTASHYQGSRESQTCIDNKPDHRITSDLRPDEEHLLHGNVDDLPATEPTMVRIFLSSTFSDMKIERNHLICNAYPELREFCRGLGLDFQVVDMRWGVTDDVLDDHATSKMCCHEVQQCQRLSLGPNFVALIGDRYGYCPVQSTIPEQEFSDIKEVIQQQSSDSTHLLDVWYRKDENAVPPHYILQPVQRGNEFEDEEDLVHSRPAWQAASTELQQLLSWAVSALLQQGKITEERALHYTRSVTEDEIQTGIMKATNPDEHAVCFMRSLDGLDMHLEDKLANKFTDITSGARDAQACQKLEKLKKDIIPSALSRSNIFENTVDWKPGGIDPNHDSHVVYLKKFCSTFVDKLQNMIGTANEKIRKERAAQSPLLKEVLLHSRFCIKKCLNFHGREEELDRAMEYVQSSSKHKTPLVIHANSGTGKTSIMAVIGEKAQSWLGGQCVVVLRFLGTTPATSDIRRTLLSVCHQINMMYRMTSLNEQVLDNPGKLYCYFTDLLQAVSSRAAGKPLLILLDSIDQLTAADGAFSMSWLPLSCPPHVSIIISTLPKTHKILETTQHLLLKKEAYLQLPDLSPATVKEIASSSLQYSDRKLTDVQMKALLAAVDRCPTPLFLKLMLDGAMNWKSYTPVNHNEMPTTSRDAILELFETLERKFGAVLMEYICSFIFCAKGISDVEMEDALSCSDEVLSSLYMFHDPPIQGVVRIPPLLWTRVRSSIDEYLVEREVDGKTVVDWYHRLFKQAVSIKYVGISRVQRFKCRNSLAQMYMAENGVHRTINLVHRNKVIENADRQVAPQPLISSNVRKLNQLPRLLISSARFDEIKNQAKVEVFCNFKWLDTKLHGTGVQNIVHDFKILEHTDEELELMRDFFRLAVSALTKNTELLAQEITARLSSEDMEGRCPRIKTLIDEARQWILQHEHPILLPLFPCLTMPGGELKATIPGPTHLLHVVEDKIGTVWGKDLGLEIWDLEMNEMVCHIYHVVSPHDILFTADKSTLFHTEDTFVIGNSSKTGARNYHFDVLPEVSKLGQKADVPNDGSFIKILAVHSDCRHIVVRINKPHMTKNLRGLLLCDLDRNTSTPLDIEAVGKTITNAAFTRNTQKVVVTLDKMIYMCGFDGQVMFKTPLPSHLTSIPVSLFLTFDDTAGMFLGSLTDLVCISLEDLSIIYAQEIVDRSQPCKIIDLYMLRNNRMLVVRYERRKKSAVLQWKKIDGSVETTRTSNTGQPKDLQVSQDDKYGILGYSEIGYVEIWDLHAFCIIHTVQAHSRDVNRSVFNDFTGTLFTSSTEHLIKIWRLPQLVNVNKLGSKKQETNERSNADGRESDITEDDTAMQPTRGIKFKNTTQLLVDHDKLDEHLFDDSFSHVADWGGSKTKMPGASPDTDGSACVSNGKSMPAGLQESLINEKGVVMMIHQKRQHISSLVVTNNGQMITSSETGPAVIWDAVTGEEQQELHGSTGVRCIHADGQGCHLIGLSIRDQQGDHGPYQLQMWNKESGSQERWQDAPFAQSIVPVADHQVALLQTMKAGSRILVLDLNTKEVLLSATCKRQVKADYLRVTDDLMYALTVDPRKCVLVWSLQNINETGFCTVKTVPVSCLPEAVTLIKGHKVITGTTYGHTLMWSLGEPPTSNVKQNQDIMLPGQQSREIMDVFVSPDQRTVVSASADNTVIIRRVHEDYLLKISEAQGQEVKVFEGHSDKVLCTYLSEDKKLLVSGSRDHTLRVWETETCKELCQFNANADTFQIHLGQDDRTVVALCHKFGARKLAMLKILHV